MIEDQDRTILPYHTTRGTMVPQHLIDAIEILDGQRSFATNLVCGLAEPYPITTLMPARVVMQEDGLRTILQGQQLKELYDDRRTFWTSHRIQIAVLVTCLVFMSIVVHRCWTTVN
jgi:hypothetical protein